MEKVNFKFETGEEVKDLVTGFKGVVTAMCKYFNGCIQYRVKPTKLTEDGEPKKSLWFDEEQLKCTKKTTKIKPELSSQTGGPQESPSGAH